MNVKTRHIAAVSAAFLFLCLISLLRQPVPDSGRADAACAAAVFCGYLLLLEIWTVSIYLRISQLNLRWYLYAEIGVMILWLTVRFLQESVIRDLYQLRISGYLICIPLVLLPLFGFFGVLGLDKGPGQRIGRWWHLLLLPAAVLIGLMLTNEWHHFVFLPEPELNLAFHPHTGIYLITAWVILLELLRIVILLKKSRRNRDYPVLRFLPFCTMILMGLLFIPHFATSFAPRKELIELSAKHFFMEALLWETCIFLGIVPVNSQYGKVFEHATVAMQITDPEGRVLLSSRYASPVTKTQFSALLQAHRITLADGLELCLHRLPGGYLIWQRDFTAINQLLQALHQTSEELQEETFLLRRELEAKSEESRLEAKNMIYDQLTAEVTQQLQLLDDLLCMNPSDSRSWSTIGLIGTYVKRLCNLRLIYQETGRVENADLKLSLENMMYWLDQLCEKAELIFCPAGPLPPDIAFMAIKLLEYLLESMAFCLQSLTCTVSQTLIFEIRSHRDHLLPVDTVQHLLPHGYEAQWKIIENGFALTVQKGEHYETQ